MKVFLYCLTYVNDEIEGHAIAENGDMLYLQKGKSKEEVENLLMAREYIGYEKVFLKTDGLKVISDNPDFKQAMANNTKPTAKQIFSVNL